MLIVEDGTNVPNANSYESVQYFRDLADDRDVKLDADDNVLYKQIIRATDYSETFDYKGTKLYTDQRLQFPRENLIIDGLLMDSEEIPELMKRFIFEILVLISSGQVLQEVVDHRNGLLTEDTVGPLTKKWGMSSVKPLYGPGKFKSLDMYIRKLTAYKGFGSLVACRG